MRPTRTRCCATGSRSSAARMAAAEDERGRASASAAASALDAIPRSMPATMEARKLGSKAAKAGFDWPDVEGLFEKLQEEIARIEQSCGAEEAR